ncbi:MAG TPA: TolC family protein, partial [Burkholderiales bacterium]|nr:TolC family protein [Burkholderiales bacterium]
MKKAIWFLLIAGCTTVGPDYRRPDMPLPAAFSGPGQESAGEIPPDWWKLYRDPTLDRLVASVHSRNSDLRIAAAQVEEAEAVMRQARAAVFPEVNLNFSRTRSRVGTLTAPPPVASAPLERNDARLVASTSFEIDFWGRVRRAGEAADASLLGTRLTREVVTLTLGGLTAQTYFGLRSLDAQITVLDNTIRLRRESLDIARARAQAGLTSELDVHQAQGALSDALVQRREAGRQRALLERQL